MMRGFGRLLGSLSNNALKAFLHAVCDRRSPPPSTNTWWMKLDRCGFAKG